MSNLKDQLKNKLKGQSPAHTQLIEPVNVDVDGNINVDGNVDENKNIYVNTNTNVNVIKKVKKKKFEEKYTRQTYYIDNELLRELNRIAGNEKGEKTRIINEALARYLKQFRQ